MTIYIVENYRNEPIFQAYKTIGDAKLSLLEEYVKNYLPEIIKCIKDGNDIIETDIENIFAHGFVEDFAYIHECELKE